ncbi:MAG TPA: glycosyltransferase family 4 protein [Gemmatales bacterium]|nr:glycosyltransferase family 4 protein [Gemmatales bacterium]
MSEPRIAILYHFFHPDDVISGQLFSGLAEDLAKRGWSVEALTSNRSCHGDVTLRPSQEIWNNVQIKRIWRPRWRQSSSRGRIFNALWMIIAWSLIALRSSKKLPHILLIGTDPVLTIMVASVVKTIRPQVRIVHWAYDLYPEAAIADDLLRPQSKFVKFIQGLLRYAYRCCDIVGDLGPCMRSRLEYYGHHCPKLTLPPWALVEPKQVEKPQPELRRKLFGDAKLTLMYSGNFGRAHEYIEFLKLARKLRDTGIILGFSVRGNRVDELRASITAEDTNIRFLPFASEAELGQHLACGDIHLVSLRRNWTGIVVPSKFFGCLASGRPVIFAGEQEASISRWIKQYQVGWHLDLESAGEVAEQLRELAKDPSQLQQMQLLCHQVYHQHFSRARIVEQWDHELKQLLQKR